jgi:hypothetical protein
LGQLVKLVFAQEGSDSGDASIPGFRYGTSPMFRIKDHAAELVQAEFPEIHSHTGLGEEYGPSVLEFDGQGDEGKDGGKQHERKGGANHIKGPTHKQ